MKTAVTTISSAQHPKQNTSEFRRDALHEPCSPIRYRCCTWVRWVRLCLQVCMLYMYMYLYFCDAKLRLIGVALINARCLLNNPLANRQEVHVFTNTAITEIRPHSQQLHSG